MKFSTLFSIFTLFISEAIALPARVPTSSHVPVSADPSPPRPFPKYSLDGGNPLEERDPLSRFSTDGKKEAADPSPPRPFPAGRIVETKDPSPPSLYPKYSLVEGNPLEERVPLALSRFPTDGEDEAHDPSPPRPFPAGRIVGVEKASPPPEQREPSAPHKLVEVITAVIDTSSPSPCPEYSLEGGNLLEERDPLSRFPTDGEKEAADPSPPRPFPVGRLEEIEDPPPGDIIEPRIPSPLLRTTEGSEAEANDPSPPRPFPTGHPAGIEPRADHLPSHRGHGGYFPPSNPPASTVTATVLADRIAHRYLMPPHVPIPTRPLPTNLPTARHRIPFATAFAPRPTPTSASTSSITTTITATSTVQPPCTTTLTSIHYHHLIDISAALTVHNTTETFTRSVNCGTCAALTVTTLDFANNGPLVSGSRSTVTVEGTRTVVAPVCSAASKAV